MEGDPLVPTVLCKRFAVKSLKSERGSKGRRRVSLLSKGGRGRSTAEVVGVLKPVGAI